MSTHRREVRPRYGRIAALAAAVTVSVVAALAGLGVLAPTEASAGLAAGPAAYTSAATTPATTPPTTATTTAAAGDPTSATAAEGPVRTPATDTSADTGADASADGTAIPAQSGTGRRIVFSQGLQRVWLVGAQGHAKRTYLVSGSVTDNLQPGTYDVYDRSRWAVGIDDSGVMQYFVRFTQGPTGAAIGFHTIPTKNGTPLQTKAQLGTPESHGCIRQATPDAIALWNFAPLHTKVVVVA